MKASEHGHKDIVDYLIRAGAGKTVDIQDIYGNTALICASSNGHGSIVQSLLGAGAAVDIKDRDGYTALRLASFIGGPKDTLSEGHKDIVAALKQAAARQRR